jgi:hypothetical protein
VIAAFATGNALASHDATEWDTAVAALAQVDPTIDPPLDDPTHVNAVGGGRVSPAEPGSSFPAFGFGATIGPAGVRGQMNQTLGFSQVFLADVFCLAAVPLPGGGGIARLVGELKEPALGIFPTMVFDVTDGGLPGGGGDMWNSQFSPLPPELVPCVATGSVSPIDGSIVIHVL